MISIATPQTTTAIAHPLPTIYPQPEAKLNPNQPLTQLKATPYFTTSLN